MINRFRTFARSSRVNKQLPLSKTLLLLLICGLGLSACASKPAIVVQPKRVVLTPPPAELMEPEPSNLRQRLQQLSGESPLTETEPSEN